MVTQLEHHQQERPCPDPVERTKSLICALNFISRNLPVPPDVYDTVSSIYYGEQEADDDVVHDDGGSDEGLVPEKASVRVFKDTLLIFLSIVLVIVVNLGFFVMSFCCFVGNWSGFGRFCGVFGNALLFVKFSWCCDYCEFGVFVTPFLLFSGGCIFGMLICCFGCLELL